MITFSCWIFLRKKFGTQHYPAVGYTAPTFEMMDVGCWAPKTNKAFIGWLPTQQPSRFVLGCIGFCWLNPSLFRINNTVWFSFTVQKMIANNLLLIIIMKLVELLLACCFNWFSKCHWLNIIVLVDLLTSSSKALLITTFTKLHSSNNNNNNKIPSSNPNNSNGL